MTWNPRNIPLPRKVLLAGMGVIGLTTFKMKRSCQNVWSVVCAAATVFFEPCPCTDCSRYRDNSRLRSIDDF